jgi:hypothetical protein
MEAIAMLVDLDAIETVYYCDSCQNRFFRAKITNVLAKATKPFFMLRDNILTNPRLSLDKRKK